jgi:3-hydroxyisobutyrate dehydrogenase-like beta-hydroxyacid dehydrogenase
MADTVCFLGFGEAAQTFAGAPGWSAASRGYDVKIASADAAAAAKRAEFARLGVDAAETAACALKDAHIVLSVVTADQSLEAAQSAAPHLAAGALYLDMNSVAPVTKQAAASLIEGHGGHYVDVAIMSPVRPAALAAPLLVCGPHVGTASMALKDLGFTQVKTAGSEIGRASLIKMVRSVLIKGVEAVSAECLLAARSGGVLDEVLDSLGADWARQLNYNLDRILTHGKRRAAELDEVARTLRDLGIEPLATASAAARQRELGELGLETPPSTLSGKLDAIDAARTAGAA